MKKKNTIASLIIAVLILTTIVGILVYNNTDSVKLRKQLKLAKRYVTEMNYDEAIIAYKVVLEIDPKNEEAYVGIINAYMAKGDYEQALSFAEQGAENTDSKAIEELVNECKAELEAEVEIVQAEETQKIVEEETETTVTPRTEREEVTEVTEAPQPEEVKSTVEVTPVVEVTPEVKEAAKPASISAKVSGNHNVGETLSASDFTVTVNMSDGSTMNNPSGWSADKLTLDSEQTEIVVSYNGMTTKIVVSASAGQVQPAEQPQQATQPAGGRPATASGALTPAAINDIIPYAQARGWSYHAEKGLYDITIHCFTKAGHMCMLGSDNYSIASLDTMGYPEPSMAMVYDFIEAY